MTIKEKIEELGPGFPINIGLNTGWIYAGNTFNGIFNLLAYLYEKECKYYRKSLNENTYHMDHFDEIWQKKYDAEMQELEKDMNIPGKLADLELQLQKVEDKIEKCTELVDKFEKLMHKAVGEGKGDSARKYKADATYNRNQLYEARGKKAYLIKTIRNLKDTGEIPEVIKEKRRQDLINDIDLRKRIDFKKTVDAIEKLTEELERPPFNDREVTEFYPIKTPWDDPRRMAIKADGIAHGKYWGEFEQVKDRKMAELIERFTVREEVTDG